MHRSAVLFFLLTWMFFMVSGSSCHANNRGDEGSPSGFVDNGSVSDGLQTGADQIPLLLSMVEGKRVGITGNQTTVVGGVHLVDTLLQLGVDVVRVFSPEHGFRGEAEAGRRVEGGVDAATGLPLVSLYGRTKKPSPADLADIDIMVFDIQDVGARFYTYISTLHYVMEACAESGIPVLVLDRPNPHGHYVDGPVLDTRFRSFIGMHPVALVHGMTMAEYARMINGEGWLDNGIQCVLKWIPMKGYSRNTIYQLPVNPSPNLQDMDAIYLYPSVCLLEGTVASVGRGTDSPFRLIGHPAVKTGDTTFVPRSIPGKSENPKFLGETCHGWLLNGQQPDGSSQLDSLDLTWLIRMYHEVGGGTKFFTSSFNLLAGNDQLKQQIINKTPEHEIRKSWQPALEAFHHTREKYLLYQ